ncbi:UL36 very large tegument protein [Streptomyces sp. NPDC093089]|uniref:UL36 very large tegument protein n=1 Tax=Streptomyces sp. NPDC093089 TaxID=3366024 RepID=UPI0038084828
MTVYQLPAEIAVFTGWLTGLAGRLRPGAGWYGVFAERDPEGLRACFDGRELLPWDVVESLLQDAGEAADGPLATQGRTLYAAAATAYDRRPGGADALAERRDLMEAERRHAETRARELGARLRATPAPDPDATARLEHDLAWTRDDHARALARVHDLTGRLSRVREGARDGARRPATTATGGPATGGPAAGGSVTGGSVVAGPMAAGPVVVAADRPVGPVLAVREGPARPVLAVRGRAAANVLAAPERPTEAVLAAPGRPNEPLPAAAVPDHSAGTGLAAPGRPAAPARPTAPVLAPPGRPAAPAPAAGPAGAPPEGGAKGVRGKRRPRGARYAWLEESAEGAEATAAPEPLPALPAGGAAPRGARFGGVAEPEGGGGAPGTPRPDSEEAVRAAANAVYALRRLRAQGRSGEAHALLCEALDGPPARLPALAAELHRAGLGADWATLLWEAASLPPGRLAAVAGALADAGRAADCEQLLRQGVARPVEELAGACAALRAEDHHREAQALLTAFVRVRAPEDAARLAGADPRGLVPQLLDAARAVSASRERDLLHALRVAGLAGI